MKSLYQRLREHHEAGIYPFHMPGHKRNPMIKGMEDVFSLDITEIEGFDDLHHPEGILREVERKAASLFHAEETHLLVNGSTVGILSSLGGFPRGSKFFWN